MKTFKSTLPIIALCSMLCLPSHSQKVEKLMNYEPGSSIRVSLNAYSFERDLNNYLKNTDGIKMTLFDLIDYCATNYIDALDATGYYFPGYPAVPSDEYIYELKNYAHRRGVEFSGIGVRNNFASPDAKTRADGISLIKQWTDVAAKLGAPVIRVFTGAVPKGYENKWDEVAVWMIDCFKECVEYGATKGVIIGVQNHADMLKTSDQILKIMKGVDSPWFGLILDIGSFVGNDTYEEIEKVIPYAVNWQIKERIYGNELTDLPRVISIIKKHGYRGYIPIEALATAGVPYDPHTAVPILVKKVKETVDDIY